MGKLRLLPARLQTLKPTLGSLPPIERSTDAQRTIYAPWRKWYSTARWQALRWTVLVRDVFTCQMCGRGPQADTAQLVADHREPHRGDGHLFWDENNLHTLCKSPCHDSLKQRAERAAQRG